MNFTINQTNGIRETVNSEFINKLYNLFITNRSSHTISLSGYLYSPTGYKALMDALNLLYGPDLVIEVPAAGLYILIEDPNVLQILLDNNISSDGIGISVADADIATFTASNSGGTFKGKTNITSFNTFNYFTRANTNPPSQLFSGCSNLESINLTEALKLSGSEFLYSGVKDLNAPKLREMGIWCFAEGKFETGTNLGLITLIPSYAFYKCSHLKSMNLPLSCETLDESAFSAYNTSYSKQFTTINIDNVTSFGSNCFYNLYVLEINASEFNSEVYNIGDDAFNSCESLTGNLSLKKLRSLGNSAFYGSGILKVFSLGKITGIPSNAFSLWYTNFSLKGKLKEVYIPQECTSIGNNAFSYRNGLTTIKQYNLSVDDPNWIEGENYSGINNVTIFGEYCFNLCSSLSLNVNELQNAITIGNNAFYECTLLTGSVIFNSLSSIGSEAFYKTGITGIDLSNTNITSLPYCCFEMCTSLTSISLPSTCKILSAGCLSGCENLQIPLSLLENIELILGDRDHYAFIGYYTSGKKALITGGTNLYLPNLKSAGFGAFSNQTSITTVNLPGLTYLHGYDTFAYCTNLTLVLSLGSVTHLNTSNTYYSRSGMFLGCTALLKVVLPNINNLTQQMFNECTNLSDLNLPTTIEGISDAAFFKTNNLTNKVMYFPNVTKMGVCWTFGNTAGMHIYLPSLSEFKTEGGDSDNTWKNSRPYMVGGGEGYPSGLFYYGDRREMTNPYTRTLYLKNITEIPAGTFYGANIDTVIINNTTIPTIIASTNSYSTSKPQINNLIFAYCGTIGKIYVPDSVYLNYYNSSLFENVKDKLERLSLCPRITLALAEAGGTGIIEDYM